MDWLAAISEKFKLCNEARHLTILLLDIFMDGFDVKDEHLKLVSLGCLLIACKIMKFYVTVHYCILPIINLHGSLRFHLADYRRPLNKGAPDSLGDPIFS